MPTYTYRCRACGQIFQRFQRMDDAPVVICPDCGGPVERLIGGGGGFIMKGYGQGGGRGGRGRGAGGCAFERTGRTCCGRSEPCDRSRWGGGH
jgi:putative FmdB family regulatory protein